MQYQNRQIGSVILFVMGLVIVIISLVAVIENIDLIWLLVITLGLITFLFHSLNIQVTNSSIKWSFGPGFWKKSIDIESVNSVRLIKTKWYYGLGIRLIPTGWLYNVSGTSAIELELKDGTKISLGTNDPDNLVKAIQSQLTSR